MIRFISRGAQIFIDLFVLSAAYWLGFMFRFEFDLSFEVYKLLFFTWPYVAIFQYLMLVAFGVPQIAWRYIGLKEMTRIFWPLAIATGVLVGFRLGLVHIGGYARFVVIPLGVLGFNFVLAFLGITGVRVMRRMLSEREERSAVRQNSVDIMPTLLIGAGRAGVLVAKEVVQNPHLGLEIVGFVDDNPIKAGTIIQGNKVLGDTASLRQIVEKTGASQAIITIASATGKTIRSIVKACEEIKLPVKIIPGVHEIIGGKVNLSRIREVTISDLLGREAVELDIDAIKRFLTGKRVLVTGAGGSIGSETCRQIARFNPSVLMLVEQAENGLFNIHRELMAAHPDLEIEPCIADICDFDRVEKLFADRKPQVVFHAAAHKHVPMMEWNPGEAIKNNVFGTKTIADAADRHKCREFVMISTDKAVNPTSIMGATKRCAEMYIQGISQKSETKFVAVRFGNVLGSAGSVIPVFKEQIASGGPVTVTHPEMKRYFMTIPEACQLVMQAATMGESGDIFILDMGEPVLIKDLAADLIKLSGFSEDEIDIQYTGLRPGEKLFEELSTDGEHIDKTRHPKIFTGRIASVEPKKLEPELSTLKDLSNSCRINEVREKLKKIVPEMLPPDTAD